MKTRAISFALWAALVAVATCVAGCQDHSFERVAILSATGDPDTGASSSQITVPEGESLVVHLELRDHEDESMTGGLESADPTVLGVRATTDGAYVFLGMKVGTTRLRVLIEGAEASSILAEVPEQTPH